MTKKIGIAGLAMVMTVVSTAAAAQVAVYETGFADSGKDWTAVGNATVSEIARRPGGKSLLLRQTKDQEANSAWLGPVLKNPGKPLRVTLWAADNYDVQKDFSYAAAFELVPCDQDGKWTPGNDATPIPWDDKRQDPVYRHNLTRDGLRWTFYSGPAKPLAGEYFRVRLFWPKAMARGECYFTDVQVAEATPAADAAAVADSAKPAAAGRFALEISTPVTLGLYFHDDPLRFEFVLFSTDGQPVGELKQPVLRYEITDYEKCLVASGSLPFAQAKPLSQPTPRHMNNLHLSAVIPDADIREFFGQDLRWAGGLNLVANLDHVPETVDETEETIAVRDGNGAVLRRFKNKTTTPEHVDFRVRDREGWEAWIKPFLKDADRRRIPFEAYRAERKLCAERQRFLFAGIVAPFELMHPVCGHEHLLAGMALDPDWVREMVMTYTEAIIRHLEILFAEEGRPDGIYFFEDLGFKERPFFSRAMYDEIMFPGHRRLFDYAHSQGCKVMMHSCGFIEPLLPGVLEAGLDCLQGMEAKAGMDLARLFRLYGDRIAFCGGVDARVLIANDRAAIDAELEAKVRPVLEGGGYILSSDHSEPPEVSYDTIRYFLEKGIGMSRHRQPAAKRKEGNVS